MGQCVLRLDFGHSRPSLANGCAKTYVGFCGDYDYTAATNVQESVVEAQSPQIFVYPASASSNVHVTFCSEGGRWQLVNAMGQTMKQGVATAGMRNLDGLACRVVRLED